MRNGGREKGVWPKLAWFNLRCHLHAGCVAANPRICSDTAADWTRCASGAMPCCFSYNCDAYNTTTCPEDDYARALNAVYKPEWAVNELHHGARPSRDRVAGYGHGVRRR